jgi:hypothetical protein
VPGADAGREGRRRLATLTSPKRISRLAPTAVLPDHRREFRVAGAGRLRHSLAIAWLTLIVAEEINADKGIGFLG